jgi:hypothetical protein
MRSSLLLTAATTILSVSLADVLSLMPEAATPWAIQWQPVLDYDPEVCKHTAAIQADGYTNPGHGSEGGCENYDRLQSCNTYARQRCNRGWCAYMYGYYAEYDDGGWWTGHRHDWESAIVWTKDDVFSQVCWSAHGDCKWPVLCFFPSPGAFVRSLGEKTQLANYIFVDTDTCSSSVRAKDTHVKLVYHHGAANSASLRLAEADDDDKIESGVGDWFRAYLISKETTNARLWNTLAYNNWGSAHPDFADPRFGDMLVKYMPEQARSEGYDAAYDDGSHR